MPIGTAISVLFHVTLVAVALVLGGVRLFHATPAEAITVDIVSSKDAPQLEAKAEPEPEKSPEPPIDIPEFTDKKTTESAAAKSKPQAQKPPAPAPAPAAAAAQPPAAQQKQASASAQPVEPPKPVEQQEVPQAQPIPFTDQTQNFSKLVGADPNDFDSAATTAANISVKSAKALREHLKTCSVLPASVSSGDQVKIVLRVWLLRDGKLAKEPLLIQASASEKGPDLFKSATDALLACQPYSELPPEKYNEWKMLDLSFTPKDFRRG